MAAGLHMRNRRTDRPSTWREEPATRSAWSVMVKGMCRTCSVDEKVEDSMEAIGIRAAGWQPEVAPNPESIRSARVALIAG